jgi:hypothetical protein
LALERLARPTLFLCQLIHKLLSAVRPMLLVLRPVPLLLLRLLLPSQPQLL